MKRLLVALEDRMTEFMQPRAVMKKEEAERDFEALCKTSPIASDMVLWELGTYDTETGLIEPIKPTVIQKGEAYATSD